MPAEPDLSRLLRHRLGMMAVTLDGDDAPPRARLVWSLMNHGGQPVDPGGEVLTTGTQPVDVITLVAIADLYGVPRGYLTAPGADPGREAMIDEDFFRIRTTTPRPRRATTYEHANRASVPMPAPAEVAAASNTARQIAQAATLSAVPWVLAGFAAGTAGTIGLAAIGTTFTWVLAGLLVGFTFARTVYVARREARPATWIHADDAPFTDELQQHLRDSIARHFHTLHTVSRLPLEQLVAILDSTTPIGAIPLDALTSGDEEWARRPSASAACHTTDADRLRGQECDARSRLPAQTGSVLITGSYDSRNLPDGMPERRPNRRAHHPPTPIWCSSSGLEP